MQASSNMPDPQPGGGRQAPVTGPAIVPSKPPEKPRSRMVIWGVLAAVVLIAGYAAYRSQSNARTSDKGSYVTVPTIVVSMGSVQKTVRVNGTVAAQNSAALLAPRIMG